MRLLVPRIALDLVIFPLLSHFHRAHPAIRIEIDMNDTFVDLMENGLDAGIRLGNGIEREMVAVRLTPTSRGV